MIFGYNIAWVVCLVGLVLYIAATQFKEPNATAAEIGRIMFAMGLLAGLLTGTR
ncbi:MAG TPA: hypothetical protein VLB68_28855 [Pyrinomonadaceae bacterium]|nr:hypothetical protein [Pyrinomonadaceae bacterium]